jgi:myosin heavy subunit
MPKLSKENFIIIHTAKNVEYNIKNFREKNKDEVSEIVKETLNSSEFPEFISIIKDEKELSLIK